MPKLLNILTGFVAGSYLASCSPKVSWSPFPIFIFAYAHLRNCLKLLRIFLIC